MQNVSKELQQQRLKDIIFLNIIVFYYPVVSIIAKFASRYEFASINFIKLYLLQVFAIGIYAILWQRAIKKFPLSLAYSNKALTIVYNMFWACLFFNEKINIQNVIGALIILIGIWVVVKDDK